MTNENDQKRIDVDRLDAVCVRMLALEQQTLALSLKLAAIRAKMFLLDNLYEQNTLNSAWYP